MIRIYFDSNVYSNLRRNEKEEYQQLNELIIRYKHNLGFFFSHAHVRDKKSDPSEFKYKDFDFMESLTKDNYLSYHGIEKTTSFYLASPLMAFTDDDTPLLNSFSFFEFLQPQEGDDAYVSALKTISKDLLHNIPLDFDLNINLDTIASPEHKELITRIFPSGQPTSYGALMENLASYINEMYSSHETYRQLRKMIDEGINNGKIVVGNTPDFNEALKETAIQKSFFDFVKDSLQKDENGNILYYDFYLQAYNALDFLSISKDKISGKNNYNNLFNDGLHSYYARYCDYLVTEDKGLNKKSKALYNLFGVHTKVFSVQEFIDQLPLIAKNTEENIFAFFAKLNTDIKQVKRSEPKEIENGYLRFIETGNIYLNTFNLFLEMEQDKDVYYFLYEENKHPLSGANYRETGMVIDKALSLFGTDSQQKGPMQFEAEVQEMRNDTWDGRYWTIGTLFFHLYHNKGLESLCLLIRPFPPQQ